MGIVIRNPLAAMRGSIQMLRGEMDSDHEHAQLMEIILRESDRLNKIVADYLNYARPRPAELNEIDLCEVVRDTLKLLKNSPEVVDGHKLIADLPDLVADSYRLVPPPFGPCADATAGPHVCILMKPIVSRPRHRTQTVRNQINSLFENRKLGSVFEKLVAHGNLK